MRRRGRSQPPGVRDGVIDPSLERPASVIKSLASGGLRPRLAMRGKSMLPSLREGMVLELDAFDRAKVRRGDVVVFRERSRLVAHRVVATYADGTLRTAGDAQPWICEHIAPIDVIGVVASVYESAEPFAGRADTPAHRRLGQRLARTRALRAAIMRPAEALRTVAGVLPWRRPPAFALLHEALTGHARGDVAAVARALHDVDENVLASFAYRHGCATLLVRALAFVQAGPEPPVPVTLRTRRLADALQADARLSGLRNIALRAQIEAIIATLRAASIRFALLKGAARLYRNDADVSLYGSRDIDIFVPPEMLDACLAALGEAGYFFKADAREQAWYRAHIHHAAPLYPPGEKGWIVEVHRRLVRPGWLWTDTRWDALEAHLQPVHGRGGSVLAFDGYGTVLHHLIHGIGLRRYRDVVVAARAYANLSPDERSEIVRLVTAERRDPIRLMAMLVLVAEFAGFPLPTVSRTVRAYLAWVRKREALPRSVRRGAYPIEAWFAAGGRLRPVALQIVADEGSPSTTLGRIVLAPLTLCYAAAMRV